MRVESGATFSSFDTAQAVALRRSKVFVVVENVRQAFSGSPNDYLAPSLIESSRRRGAFGASRSENEVFEVERACGWTARWR